MAGTLKTLLAKASPLRSGDQLAGLAAATQAERVRAQMELADVPLQRFLDEPLIPYEQDEVTRLILDEHDTAAFAPVHLLTVSAFRAWLLDYATTTPVLEKLAPGLAEMAFSGSLGMEIHLAPDALRNEALLFSESNTRFVVEVHDEKRFLSYMKGAPIRKIGNIRGGGSFRIFDGKKELIVSTSIGKLKAAWQAPFKKL